MDREKREEQRLPYEKPSIQSEQIFERTALACGQDPFLNTQVDPKDNSTTCGYNDS